MTAALDEITRIIAQDIGARPEQVRAAIALLDEGSTVPFIARYRKEATGGLDDGQLRQLEERLGYLRELDARRETIRKSIEAQGKLTEELAAKIAGVTTKAELEDLYLPFKPKRRTKGQIARERGLEPLAAGLLADRGSDPETAASAYLGDEVPDTKAALEGARDILVEQFAEQPDLLGRLRRHLMARAKVQAKLVAGKQEEGAKYADYFDYAERWATIPSHRALALFRARNEDVVTVEIVVDEEDPSPVRPVEAMIAAAFAIDTAARRPADSWLMGVVRAAWRTKLAPHLSTELLGAAARARRGGGDLASSRATSRTCCSRRRPARGRPWGSIRACARASRSPWSTPPASCSRRPPSTRSSRATTSRARCGSLRAWSGRTASS